MFVFSYFETQLTENKYTGYGLNWMPLMRYVLSMLRFYNQFFSLKVMLDLRLHTTRGRLPASHNNHRS